MSGIWNKKNTHLTEQDANSVYSLKENKYIHNESEYSKQIEIFSDNHSLYTKLSHIITSIPSGMPSFVESVKIFIGMCVVIIITSTLLAGCDTIISKIVYLLLGVQING